MKVLVVEDDPGTRSALGRLLRRAGAVVVTTGDGSEGLQHLLADRFDVLLTDLHMPRSEMDGFALIEQTHRLPLANRPRRVVAISGEYNRHVLRGQTGVDFFQKPVDLNQLLDTIGGLAH
jgi:two-component system chemotaxis response regulator CheY